MNEEITIKLSHDEALVLFDFFARFAETNDFCLRHNAEYLAFCRIAAPIEKALVEPFLPEYLELLGAARERIATGYEGLAPGVSKVGDDR